MSTFRRFMERTKSRRSVHADRKQLLLRQLPSAPSLSYPSTLHTGVGPVQKFDPMRKTTTKKIISREQMCWWMCVDL
ncbi:unnamed protein product [Larinioides sclopetarius]|uniref:Uncharacterized protein n=1 Tax=Larinioides sclopetarius TaxID=280406 RepID=A0AAV1Z3X5_9ARAC